MTTPEKKGLIDGSFYESLYADARSDYFKLYIENGIPNQAQQINQHYVDFAIWLFGLPPGARVLEAGCGVGHKIGCWNRRGFDCRGVEVSSTARILSPHREQIDIGSVSELEILYGDSSFDLVFSHGLMEHIDDSVLARTIDGFFRVSTRQFHVISIDKGVDPGHIQVLDAAGWLKNFAARMGERARTVGVIPDFIVQESREIILIESYWGLLPYPVKKMFDANRSEYPQTEKENAK